MKRKMKRFAALVLSFSMIVSLGACTNKDSKVEEEDGVEASADLFLDALVNLKAKSIKKLNKELGLGKNIQEELNEIAENEYVQVVMKKATYTIDPESIEENTKKKKASCEATVTLPDYERALDDADDFEDFEELIDSQKEKKYKEVTLELEFDIEDDQYVMDSEVAGDAIEDLYDDMIESIEDFEWYNRKIPTTPTTTTETMTPPTTTEEYVPPTTDYYDGVTTAIESYGNGSIEINMFAMSPEVPGMVKRFMADNPDMASKYRVTAMVSANTGGAYVTKLNAALTAGGDGAPDIYVAEADYILPYTQGDLSSLAAPYADFIDNVDGKLKTAGIAQYTVDLGTNPDGKLVALCYQCTGGAMIYSASIAKEVFGSDDPAEVKKAVGGGSGNWDTFKQAAAKLNAAGYAACADFGDLWNVCEKAASTPWVVDGKVNIDPQRDAYMDLIKEAYDNNWTNETGNWNDAWYAAMNGESRDPKTNETRKVFAFFGPAWLINYTMGDHSANTKGDWRVCESPVGFWWGGSWLCVNKKGIQDADKKIFLSKFVEWVTLDCSDTGLQYLWASGAMNDNGTKDTVASSTVLAKVKGDMALLGGQDAFPIFISATSFASAKCKCLYDDQLNGVFMDNAADYARGKISKQDAINNFKDACAEKGIEI